MTAHHARWFSRRRFLTGVTLAGTAGFLGMQGSQAQIVKSSLAGDIDLSADSAPSIVLELDAGAPLVTLAGIHVGCFELVGSTRPG